MKLCTDPAVLQAAPFSGTLKNILLDGAITRPSTVTGEKYDAVSTAFFTSVHDALMGHTSAESSTDKFTYELESMLRP